MRILRGLSSRVLPCGCLTGLYETYDSRVVGIIDARGAVCDDASHRRGQMMSVDAPAGITVVARLPFDRHPPQG
jgi:hypothetical protein